MNGIVSNLKCTKLEGPKKWNRILGCGPAHGQSQLLVRNVSKSDILLQSFKRSRNGGYFWWAYKLLKKHFFGCMKFRVRL